MGIENERLRRLRLYFGHLGKTGRLVGLQTGKVGRDFMDDTFSPRLNRLAIEDGIQAVMKWTFGSSNVDRVADTAAPDTAVAIAREVDAAREEGRAMGKAAAEQQ